MPGSPPKHHYILGSVSTFKHDDLSVLKTFMWVPSTTPLYSWFSFNIQVWWPFCNKNIHAWVPSTTPLYPWFNFNMQARWPLCTKKIHEWVPLIEIYVHRTHTYLSLLSPSTTTSYPWVECNIQTCWPFCTKKIHAWVPHHTTIFLVHFQYSSMMTFLHLNIHVWVPFTTLLHVYPSFSFNIQGW